MADLSPIIVDDAYQQMAVAGRAVRDARESRAIALHDLERREAELAAATAEYQRRADVCVPILQAALDAAKLVS